VEQASEHPLATAIVAAAAETKSASDVKTIAGRGVVGVVDGHRISVTNESFDETAADRLRLGSSGAAAPQPPRAGEAAGAPQSTASTVVFVRIDDKPAALIAIADPIKATTPE